MMDNKETMYLGVDWGEKRIGLAIGDGSSKLASPFGVVENLSELLVIIKEEKIESLILGAPISMCGGDRNFSQAYRDFFKALKEKLNIPLYEVDERLTTKQANRLPGSKKTKAARDAVAAMIILQSFFDKIDN